MSFSALRRKPWRQWRAAGVLVVAAFAVYARSWDAPFVFDDLPAVVQNESIRDLSRLDVVLTPQSGRGGVDGRPLVNLSLALNYAVGELNPRGYHLMNIALHALGALALFGLVRRTLQLPGIPERLTARARTVAFFSALWWTVHPLQSETVICTVQRTEAMLSMFYLFTIYAFLRAVTERSTAWRVVGWLAALAGMASKEVMATAPLAVLLFDRTFLAGTFRAAWRERWTWHVGFAATWVLLAVLVWHAGGQRGRAAGFGLGISSWEYLLTQARAIVIYVKLTLWPYPLVVDYGTWVAGGLREVAVEFVAVAAAFCGAVFACWRWPRAGFPLVFFFLVLGPSSSVVPLVGQTIAEHRMHLPLAGLLTALVVGAFYVWRRAAVVGCVLIVAAMAVLTVRRSMDYRDELTLWTDLVAKTPDNPWARFHLGSLRLRRNEFAAAENELRFAAARLPLYAPAHFALGSALLKREQPEEALREFEAALRLEPRHVEAHFRAGMALLALGRPREALGYFERTVRLAPEHADAEGNWGAVLFQVGEVDAAVTHFERLVELRPESADARYNLGLALARLGRDPAAREQLAAAVRLRPQEAEFRFQLAQVLLRLGEVDAARAELRDALRLQPTFEAARRMLERVEGAR